ncbi:hypothetical protein An07g00710 [Aspergillus niger]|uniref:Uncharacterized protein n=2 Tax=Aspergillus niger TaxID=5061 RepID=A2QM40_ASPNC|nr:hypothetical protein An07g00710 [Aspergillus niger]CAK39294.1 hypothetical protein An07g00710 [Aspergillus niger]
MEWDRSTAIDLGQRWNHPANETMPTGHVKKRWSTLLTVGRTEWNLPIVEPADLPVSFNGSILLSTIRRGHSARGGFAILALRQPVKGNALLFESAGPRSS